MEKEGKTYVKEITGADIKVCGYSVLLKSVELPDKSRGGLILPHAQEESKRSNLAEIIAVGPLAFTPSEKFPERPEVGDVVIYCVYEKVGVPFKDKNTNLFFLNDDRVLAIIKKEDINKFIGN